MIEPAVAALAFALVGVAPQAAGASPALNDVRAVSYYPARGGWTLMWTRFRPAEIERDFARIASLKANTVRIVVAPSAFGYPEPDPEVLGRLDRVLALAARHGLSVQLTLFDWWHDYHDLEGSKRWASSVLARYRGDPRLALVELKNEIQPRDPDAVAWARELLRHVRGESGLAVGISVPALDVPADLAALGGGLADSPPDFYSAHFYWHPGYAYDDLRRAREAVAPVPLVLGETGYSTDLDYPIVSGIPRTSSAREAAQAYYLRSLAVAAGRLGLAPIQPWVLSDFTQAAIPRDDPGVFGNPREYRFGLFRVSGAPKPAADALRWIFQGRRSYRFNNGFEEAVSDEHGRSFPAFWGVQSGTRTELVRDAAVAHGGRASARIAATSGPSGRGAFTITPPHGGVRPGDVSTATAYARATRRCGRVTLSIAWYARSGRPVARARSRPLRCGGEEWQLLSVTGTAPGEAVHVEIGLRAARIRGSAWFDDVAYSCRRGHARC